MGWVVNATIRPTYTRERPGTHFIGGWLGSMAGLDGCEKSRPHRHYPQIHRHLNVKLALRMP